MTIDDGGENEEEIARIDEEIDSLSSRKDGFDFAREVRRVRSMLFGDVDLTIESPSKLSKHARAKRIKELQRRREQLLKGREIYDSDRNRNSE